ncbi:uncharacterized protein LOC105179797 [Sesamum indicum]|uniref:Uncharacterized protein LOC105179797 n=1 Tax=Sesamum indicum TaxID=4182 RepID=A0A6I9UIU0_SESIN|nr:uncharacterized protein LOC105179797 [Sesamum indicum]
MNLRSPTTIKEVHKLTGKIASLSRFISRSADRSLPFFKVFRKSKNFAWIEECEKALQELKEYLTKPHLLANPKEEETLLLYFGISENAVSSVLVREEAGNQNLIYYVSKMLQGVESKYSEIEKLALALVVTARKLRPYFQSHKVVVLINHPLKHVMSRLEASGRLIKWVVELGQYDVDYQPRTAQKAQVLADFVTELSSDLKSPLAAEEQGSKWMLHVDGSSMPTMEERVPRTENDKADALSKFGAAMDGIRDRRITALVRERSALASRMEVQVVSEAESWKDEIIKYLENNILPTDPVAAKRVKFRATRFTMLSGQLYKRTLDGPLLKCLDEERALYVMREIHEESCGNHSGARSLAQKIIRQVYFLPTLVKDSNDLVKKCESYQKYASLIHQPAISMEPIKIACPFDQWGIDIVGPFPPAQAQKKFIIVAVEYFSKWVEAEAVAKISEREVINFIWKNIICRFGKPRILISDNRTQFQGRKITE